MTCTVSQCAVCSKPGKLCASCENIHYCGRDCQKADWAVHKLLCRSFKDARDPPGPNMMRVIVFPVNRTEPEFRWMPIKSGTIQRPLVGNYFGLDDPFTGFLSFPLDPKTGAQLSLRITVQSRDNFLNDGSLPNRALYHFTNGVLRHKFAGPVLVYGNAIVSHSETNIEYVNLDTTHLNVIRDWFMLGFYAPEDEKGYIERFEYDSKWPEFGVTEDLIDQMNGEMRRKGETLPKFHAHDFGTPEFCRWHDKVARFKKKWDEKKYKEGVANRTLGCNEFRNWMGEEEGNWRSEMRISGRALGLDAVQSMLL